MTVLRLSDDGRRLRFASAHVDLCTGTKNTELSETLTVLARRPARWPRGRKGLLIARPVRRGTLTATLRSRWVYTDGVETLTGRLTLRRIRERSLAGTWQVNVRWNPKRGDGHRCQDTKRFRAVRNPGHTYVGDTSDSEPFALFDTGAAEVIVGYAVYCPRALLWGVFYSTYGFGADGTFGSDELQPGLVINGEPFSVMFNGRRDENRASGELRLVGRPAQRRPCDSGRLTWKAVVG